MGRRGAVIKRGRDVIKTIILTNYGDRSSGEVKKRELRFRTHENRRGQQPDYDEPDPKTTWWCEGKEIERVLAFLQSNVARTGRYRIVDTDSSAGIILDLLQSSDSGSEELVNAILQYGDPKNLIELLSASDRGSSIAQLAVIEKRRQLIRDLQILIRNPHATETQIQRLIGKSYWIFGGRYVGIADRRDLIPLDQHDIPLLGADGTLHIVELKGPCIQRLIRRYRNHWIVGNEINEAVGQATNYIRGLDELGTPLSSHYLNEFGRKYDMRRVFATVVIGHPGQVSEVGPNGKKPDEETVQHTIRSYNSHLSRIEVRTYKDLADAAERALIFENEATLSEPDCTAADQTQSGREQPPYDDPWSDEPPF